MEKVLHDFMVNFALAVGVRFAKWDNIVFGGNALDIWNGRVDSEDLTDYLIQVRKSIQLIHRWSVRLKPEQLLAELCLNSRCAR